MKTLPMNPLSLTVEHVQAQRASLYTRMIALGRAWMRRRHYMRLYDLDDHLLDDIGVTRGEVQIAAGLPLSENASVELHRMAYLRRSMRM